jgi:hypothetical protein
MKIIIWCFLNGRISQGLDLPPKLAIQNENQVIGIKNNQNNGINYNIVQSS